MLEAKREQRRAEASRTSAGAVIAAANEAPREAREADEADTAAPATKAAARPDRTVLLLIALMAVAAGLYWLTQRSPRIKETKIEAAPAAAPTSSAKR